jgi:hypothetical protein
VVQVPDLAGAAIRVCGPNKLPHPLVGVVAYQQDRFAALENFGCLDARGRQELMPHPPSASITLQDTVGDPPHERQVLMGRATPAIDCCSLTLVEPASIRCARLAADIRTSIERQDAGRRLRVGFAGSAGGRFGRGAVFPGSAKSMVDVAWWHQSRH